MTQPPPAPAMPSEPGLAGDEALSLLDSHADPFARMLILAVAGLVAAAFLWAGWAEVEEIVAATGRVQPVGKSKLINHPTGGRISELAVREGQEVASGDLLARLDSSVLEEEIEELTGRLEVVAMTTARLEAEIEHRPIEPPADLATRRPDLVASETALIEARAQTETVERTRLGHEIKIRAGAVAEHEATIARLQRGNSLLQDQLASVRELTERGLYPRLKLVGMEREASDVSGELAQARAALGSAEAALAEARSRLDSFDSARRTERLDELAASRAEREQLRERLEAYAARLGALDIVAPVAGIVDELQIATRGQSIGAHEPFMRIVPLDGGLIIEARIANDDIGRIGQDMPARIKVRAFDYLRHGTLRARITRIAPEASETAAAPDQEPGYVVTLETEEPAATTGEAPAALSARSLLPGMLVEVELEAGRRTILSYLTDRIWQLRDEAFREG